MTLGPCRPVEWNATLEREITMEFQKGTSMSSCTITGASSGQLTSVTLGTSPNPWGLGARRDGQVSYGTQRGPLRAAAVRP